MATSNNTTWELTRDQIITRAYAKIGIPGEGNTLTTNQISDGAEALNSVVALAVTDGMPLWKRTTEQLALSTTSQQYTLTNAIKVVDVFLRDTSGSQYSIKGKSLYDFMALPRNSQGVPVHWQFTPSIQGGTLQLWPLTSDSTSVSTKTIQVVYQKEFDGFVSGTDTADFPAYWLQALVYKTAVLLAPEHGVPLNDRQALKAEAQEYWALASSYGDEASSFFIQPEKRY